MATYILTISDRTGKRLPGCTSSTTSISIYTDKELANRLAAARRQPTWSVTYRTAPEVTR